MVRLKRARNPFQFIVLRRTKVYSFYYEALNALNVMKVPTASLLDLFSTLAVVFCHVQALVDYSRDGLDLCAELLLNRFKVEAIVVCDQVDGQTQVAKASWEGGRSVRHVNGPTECLLQEGSLRALTRSTNAMKVRLSQLGKIKVDHNIHSLNVNSSCEEI